MINVKEEEAKLKVPPWDVSELVSFPAVSCMFCTARGKDGKAQPDRPAWLPAVGAYIQQ